MQVAILVATAAVMVITEVDEGPVSGGCVAGVGEAWMWPNNAATII